MPQLASGLEISKHQQLNSSIKFTLLLYLKTEAKSQKTRYLQIHHDHDNGFHELLGNTTINNTYT